MTRISHKTPMAAFDHVSALLKAANGGDKVISRDDAKALVAQLQKDGKGTEAAAARNIFKLVDARDTTPGARVTAYDLDKVRDFVQTKMLENRDINKNGFARAEIEKMSPTGRARRARPGARDGEAQGAFALRHPRGRSEAHDGAHQVGVEGRPDRLAR